MTRAYVVLHDHASAGGHVSERLRQRGFTVDEVTVVPPDRFTDPGVDFEFPAPADYDLLVPMGSPWSVYDEDRIGSWVKPELAWLADAVAVDIPVFGICFGAQALATALGGATVRSERPEVGWIEVGSDDPGLVPSGPWLEWHYDRFTLPSTAVELARNDLCTQAFRYGRSLGVQFHPEVRPEDIAVWLANGGAAEARAIGVDPDALLRECAARADDARSRAYALVDAYLARIGGIG
ncbi:MAG TPA: type 1 glutamine amidotransferase [Pseudonocardiaceae bacterium]|nr:type 1 glutamine amidotransferase [Pseudonocardiaceae bacterium]